MSAAAQVDWDAVVRRSRRRQWCWVPLMAAWLWAGIQSYLPLFDSPGRRWFLWGTTVVVCAVVARSVAVRRRTPPTTSPRDMTVARHALLRHLDPGGSARTAADRLARTSAATRWSGVLYVLLAATFLLEQRDRSTPVTVIAMLGYVGGFLAFALWSWYVGTAGRRWLADPPGPPREPRRSRPPRNGWPAGGRSRS